MRKKVTMFPELAAQMARKGETQDDLARLIGVDRTNISRRLTGQTEWTIGEVEILCNHYNMDFWELFKRKENKNEVLED